MPLVSIIVPIYNAEKNLRRCIDSILKQTYKKIEIILLNDGSSDDSGYICDAYAKLDNRIRVVHKENTGVSDTRNQGIAMSKGEYIQFLDSDDWITADATSCFVKAAQKYECDIVVADFYRVINDRVSQKGTIEEDGLIDRITYATNMMHNPADFYYGVLWNKLYKRSVIEKYQLRMDNSINWCEDFMFNLEYIRHINSIYILKVPIYYYVKTKGSLVSQGMSMKKTVQMKRRVFQYYNHFYKDVFGEEDYEKRKMKVYRFLFDAADDGSVYLPIIPGNYKLGTERSTVSDGVQSGTGFFFDMYREQKLRDVFFEVVAFRNELTIVDVKVLYYLRQQRENCTHTEVAKILNVNKSTLSFSLKKLVGKKLIKIIEERKDLSLKKYVVASEADDILSEIPFAISDFEQLAFEGFSQEEIELYEKMNEKRNQNIKNALRE